MIDLKSNRYTFLFAVIVCVVSGVMLSAVSEGFRARQELNMAMDVKKNILKAVVLKEPIPPKAAQQDILKVFESKIEEHVIDGQGNVMEGRKPADIKDRETGVYPMYIYKEDARIMAYAFPIVGQGLWSTLYGYLALEPDAVTVRGITFYKHGETPGLGGEIEKDWFQNNFKGKKVWSIKESKLTPIVVLKGRVVDHAHGDSAEHSVDGITAATLTGNGVTEMMDKWLRIYEPYLSKARKR
ncbi:MAG: NADH:ubiquinone reductase (Na(+)-transporting) subunit C [Candidatus Omnitrophota bacterium]|nr:NADH:ubiquinone reductase (Na(+)-transporting) subunit C [Candidatus Omnitrophota bacterium]MDZ4241437.1 NADH:ubiquinone reductase (Na(+)-transporting) subunit C [Candidatus Omnitrophota bacterium]